MRISQRFNRWNQPQDTFPYKSVCISNSFRQLSMDVRKISLSSGGFNYPTISSNNWENPIVIALHNYEWTEKIDGSNFTALGERSNKKRKRPDAEPFRLLFSPPVRAVGIGAHVVEFHLLFGPARLRLEEDGLAVRALGARVVLGPRQRRVRNHVGHDLRQLAAKSKTKSLVNKGSWKLTSYTLNCQKIVVQNIPVHF